MPRGVSRYDEARLQGRLWTPAELRANGKLRGWWDYGDLATIAMSGGALSSVSDKSGSGVSMVVGGSAGAATLVRTELDGRNVLQITDGGYLEASAGPGTFGTAVGLTFASVWRKIGVPTTYNAGPLTRSYGNQPAPFDSWDNNRYVGMPGNYTLPGYSTGAAPNLNGDARFLAWNILAQICIADPAYHYIERVSGVQLIDDALTWYSDESYVLTVGSRADHVTSSNMQVAEQVAAVGLNLQDRLKLEGYLAWKRYPKGGLLKAHPFSLRPPLIGD